MSPSIILDAPDLSLLGTSNTSNLVRRHISMPTNTELKPKSTDLRSGTGTEPLGAVDIYPQDIAHSALLRRIGKTVEAGR